jgi:hypothetical protein
MNVWILMVTMKSVPKVLVASSTGCSKQEKFQHRSRRSGKKSETREEKTMLVDCLLQEELQDRLLGNAGRQSQLQKLAEDL